MYTYININVYTYIYIYIHIHAHEYIYIYIHIQYYITITTYIMHVMSTLGQLLRVVKICQNTIQKVVVLCNPSLCKNVM